MPNDHRSHVPGGTFFFTVVTHRRRKLFHLKTVFGSTGLKKERFEKGKSVDVRTERVP
jgi:REP element-mobilizing transposase RayT